MEIIAIIICFIIAVGVPVFCYLTYKYNNPYKLIMVFGKKGSGKTTFLAKTAYKYLRKGRPVYSTVHIPGTYLFDPNDIAKDYPPEAVLLMDEVGMIFDNRNFKTFRPEWRDYFKLQRHYHHTVYLFSQTFDVDVKLRNLTDAMYLCRCYFGFLTIAKKIKRDIVLVQPQGDSESRIADSLEFVPWWLSIFGAQTIIFTFIPKWCKLFDSYDAPKLPDNKAVYVPVPEPLKKFYHVKDDQIDVRRMVKDRLYERYNRFIRKRNGDI